MIGPNRLDTEKHIYPKAAKGIESLRQAIVLFEGYLSPGSTGQATEYYKARNLVKEGDAFFREALKNAKKLLGPLPAYVTEEYKLWRTDFLHRYGILAKKEEIDHLEHELREDEFLNKWLTSVEIEESLKLIYNAQKEGMRKLANIKVRIILDHLSALLNRAKALQKQALAKQQSPG